MRYARGILLLTLVLILPLFLKAQDRVTPSKILYTKFTADKITLDGIPDETAWQTVEPATDFIQRDPTEGVPVSQRTEARVLFDKENLYIAIYCFERDPKEIAVRDINWDFVVNQQDFFGVILDTFNDDRSGFSMGTNARGGQQDLQILDETRDTNHNWDGVWHVKSHIDENGWTAEFAIPFKTLRFSKEKSQVWGIQFFRRIRRRNELSWWTKVARRYVGWYVSPAGELRGLEDIRQGRNLKIKPYVLTGAKKFESQNKTAEGDFQGGLDIKYGVTPGLTLDLTANTDFSQVEVDTQQVNLTRFPLFFPEKREFFLENGGIFQLGETYTSGVSRSEEVLPFFSRRIGLSAASPDPIPILGGGRLTGRAGKFYVGLLDMQTRSHGSVPANNFAVGRIRSDFFGNSDAGLLFTNRQSARINDYNRMIGGDLNLRFTRDFKVNTVLAKTTTPGRKGDARFTKLEGIWQTNLVRALGSYMDTQKNFLPDVGFVRRPGRKILHNEAALRPRLTRGVGLGKYVREIFPLVISDYAILPGGITDTKLLRSQLRLEFQDGSSLEFRDTRNFERLTAKFPIPAGKGITVPAGDYRFNDFLVSYNGDRSKTLSGNAQFNTGDYYTGTKDSFTIGGQLQFNYRFSSTISYERNNVDLPQGSFSTDLVNWKFNYSFSPKMFLSALFQYNSNSNEVSSNIRFRFIHHPLSDLYIVYNEQRNTNRHLADRAISVKYTHLFSF